MSPAQVEASSAAAAAGSPVEALFGMATRQRTVCLSGGDRAERFTNGKSFQVPPLAALCSSRIAICMPDRCGSLYSDSLHAHTPAAEAEPLRSACTPLLSFQQTSGAHSQGLSKVVIAPCFAVLLTREVTRIGIVSTRKAHDHPGSARCLGQVELQAPPPSAPAPSAVRSSPLRGKTQDPAATVAPVPSFAKLLEDSIVGQRTNRGWFDEQRRYQLLEQSQVPTHLPQVPPCQDSQGAGSGGLVNVCNCGHLSRRSAANGYDAEA